MLGDAKVEGRADLEDDVALPFLEADTYYPTLLPFQRVNELHDSEALSRPALPPDLAEQKVGRSCLHVMRCLSRQLPSVLARLIR